MTTAVELHFRPLPGDRGESVAVMTLSRPDAANAFNDAVLRESVQALAEAAARKGCRALVLRGKGRHFSAGADLAWMKAAAQLSYEENVKDAQGLTALFEALANLPLPTIGLVHGSAFGGAVGLTACCDIAIAARSAKFCLSEIRLGLMPAVILPYLARKMRPGDLRRLALTARPFTAEEAREAGLVQRVVDDEGLEEAARLELAGLLQGSPEAQADLKALLARVTAEAGRQGPHTAEGIAKLRAGPVGQAGLAAFFDKKPAPWALSLSQDWSLDG